MSRSRAETLETGDGSAGDRLTEQSGGEAGTRLVCRNLWKVYGEGGEKLAEQVDPALSREEVLAQTGCVLAVRDVSFRVGEGETFVIMGLSGSGKSTLVRCLGRLIEPTRGQVSIDGEDLLAMNKQQLREIRRHKMGMVFQHFGNFPHKRVLDNVVYGLQVQGGGPGYAAGAGGGGDRPGGPVGVGGTVPA